MNTLWLQEAKPAICQASVNSDTKHSMGDLKNIQNQPVVSCTIFPSLLSQASYRKLLCWLTQIQEHPAQNKTLTCDLLSPTQLTLKHIESCIKRKKKSYLRCSLSLFSQKLNCLPQLESSLQLSDSLQSHPLQKKASVIYANLYKAARHRALHQPLIMFPPSKLGFSSE